MIGEHYRNAMHWRRLGVAACGQRASDGQPVTRHCTDDPVRVSCAKCMRLAVRRGAFVPLRGKQLDLDLPT